MSAYSTVVSQRPVHSYSAFYLPALKAVGIGLITLNLMLTVCICHFVVCHKPTYPLCHSDLTHWNHTLLLVPCSPCCRPKATHSYQYLGLLKPATSFPLTHAFGRTANIARIVRTRSRHLGMTTHASFLEQGDPPPCRFVVLPYKRAKDGWTKTVHPVVKHLRSVY